MNELMKLNIRKELKSNGIEPDLIDIEALWDDTLTYNENRANIIPYVKATQGKKEAEEMNKQAQIYAQEQQAKTPATLKNLLSKNRVIGVVGNRSSGKTSLALTHLLELNEFLKSNKNQTKVYVFGAETSIRHYLKKQGLSMLYNKEDILDLKLKNSIIFIDEIASIFSSQSKDKETDKLKRFFARIEHNNCWVIMATAETGYWNKFMTSFVNCFLVKGIEYDSLVNGTPLKRWITGIETTSDYRLELEPNEYFIINNGLTEKKLFNYNPELDSKKDNLNPFCEKNCEKFPEEKNE